MYESQENILRKKLQRLQRTIFRFLENVTIQGMPYDDSEYDKLAKEAGIEYDEKKERWVKKIKF
jgi:hypothetical protein